MSIYRFKLSHPSHVSLSERETALAVSRDVRMAFSVRGFDEHVIWPTPDALQVIVEGKDPGDLARALDAFSATVPWTEIGYIEVSPPEDDNEDLVGPRWSHAVIRAAIEGEETRCDFCSAIDPPPHEEHCPYARRDDEIAGGMEDSGDRGAGSAETEPSDRITDLDDAEAEVEVLEMSR